MLEKLKNLWFRVLYWVLVAFAFNRVTITGKKSDGKGPVLYVCLHRNGALDGAVYQRVAPRAKMTLSSQLRRKAWMRAIFDGIEILRPQDLAKDGARVNNAESFAKAAQYLADGGELVFFPEGTSELGPRHLKFRTGVAKLIRATLEHGPALKVVPLAAHYEDAPTWQSNVDVRVGEPLMFEGMPTVPEIMDRVTRALEDIGLDCETLKERETIEALAYAATLGNKDIPYSKALKALAGAVDKFDLQLKTVRSNAGVLMHQGIPLVPIKNSVPYAVALAFLFPFQLLMLGINSPAFSLMEALVERMSDAPNVRSLFRSLTGVGLLTVWGLFIVTPVLFFTNAWLVLVYWLATVLQLKTMYRTKKLLIAVANVASGQMSLSYSRASLLEFHNELTAYVRSKL